MKIRPKERRSNSTHARLKVPITEFENPNVGPPSGTFNCEKNALAGAELPVHNVAVRLVPILSNWPPNVYETPAMPSNYEGAAPSPIVGSKGASSPGSFAKPEYGYHCG